MSCNFRPSLRNASTGTVAARCAPRMTLQNDNGRIPKPVQTPVLRRQFLMEVAGVVGFLGTAQSAQALGFKKELKKRKVPESEYSVSELDGLKFYDFAEGQGPEIKDGSNIVVHFDCKFRGIDVVSTRAARLLGGNRTIAEPFQFTAGESLSLTTRRASDRGGGGLYAGDSGPKPPPALSTAVIGMKQGGKRSVLVTPEQGYGDKGILEIPPNSSFELQIEVLEVK